jgi:hypothetical protein
MAYIVSFATSHASIRIDADAFRKAMDEPFLLFHKGSDQVAAVPLHHLLAVVKDNGNPRT